MDEGALDEAEQKTGVNELRQGQTDLRRVE
jgi:hypothetical protein